MGLFDRRHKANDTKPLEEYLKQRGQYGLMVQIKSMMAPMLPGRENSIIGGIPLAGFATAFLTGKSPRYLNQAEPIPKVYLKANPIITVEKLLELCMELGSAEAAFYLAVMYEHGLGVNRDQRLADGYYQQASQMPASSGGKSVGQVYVEAMDWLKKGHTLRNPNFTDSATEELAMTILFADIIPGEDKKPHLQTILHSCYDDFIRLGVMLVSHYAKQEHPYSCYILGLHLRNINNAAACIKAAYANRDPDNIRGSGVWMESILKILDGRGNPFARNILSS